MCEECAPSVPASRLLGHNGYGYYFGHVNDAASNNIKKLISLVSGLMWNYSSVYGEMVGWDISVRDLFERQNSLKRKSAMMFSVPLVLWECSNNLLPMIVYPNHRDIMLWSSYLTGSNEAL